MATLEEFRKYYYEFSGKASDRARHLAFAGVAIVWIFRTGQSTETTFPKDLLFPLILFATVLALDFFQYVAQALSWGIFSRWHEKTGAKDEQTLTAPQWMNWVPLAMFWGKIIIVTVAYLLLIFFLVHTFRTAP